MSIRAAKAKLNISEIPGDEPPRIGGKAKLQVVRWGLAYYSQVLYEFFFNSISFREKRRARITSIRSVFLLERRLGHAE